MEAIATPVGPPRGSDCQNNIGVKIVKTMGMPEPIAPMPTYQNRSIRGQ